MSYRARPDTSAHIASQHEMGIFRTALRQIGRGFVEIAQGIGLIGAGTLRPVRSLVPSLPALVSIAALSIVTLGLVVTTVAQAETQRPRDNGVWTRWNHSSKIRFRDNTIARADLDHLAEGDAWLREYSTTTFVAS
ncbi:MAG: hypothetical protein JSW27_16635 [Phycisphaerales bacterium]|nr:MAG: hypothetical protein JSW27_16635 [Phycisphaerales bacterium]